MRFVNPTYEDNFPTTNIEALACGTPVITYDTGGSPEAVDKSTGFVVDKGDIAGIVRCDKSNKGTWSRLLAQSVQAQGRSNVSIRIDSMSSTLSCMTGYCLVNDRLPVANWMK